MEPNMGAKKGPLYLQWSRIRLKLRASGGAGGGGVEGGGGGGGQRTVGFKVLGLGFRVVLYWLALRRNSEPNKLKRLPLPAGSRDVASTK